MKSVLGSLLLLIVCCGCGGGVAAPVEVTDPEEKAIKDMINSLEGAGDEFKDLFTGDPPNQKEFRAKYMIQFPPLEPEVTVNGDSADVKVAVSTVSADGGSDTAFKTWKLKKVDGNWKIETWAVD